MQRGRPYKVEMPAAHTVVRKSPFCPFAMGVSA